MLRLAVCRGTPEIEELLIRGLSGITESRKKRPTALQKCWDCAGTTQAAMCKDHPEPGNGTPRVELRCFSTEQR